MAHSESGVVVNGTQVSYIGHDCELIPEFLAANYGSSAKRLDLSFNQLRVAGSLEPISRNSAHKVGDTPDVLPTHREEQLLTRSHNMDDLEMPVSLQHMSLDWGRKPEYLEETPNPREKKAPRTQGGGGIQAPNH